MWKTYMRLPQRRWITANARRNGVKKVCWYAEAVGIDPRVYKPAKGVLLETPRLFFLWNLHLNINSALTRDSIPILPGYALLSEIDIRTVKYASYRDALSSPVRVEPLHKDAPYLALHVGSSPLPPVKPIEDCRCPPRLACVVAIRLRHSSTPYTSSAEPWPTPNLFSAAEVISSC